MRHLFFSFLLIIYRFIIDFVKAPIPTVRPAIKAVNGPPSVKTIPAIIVFKVVKVPITATIKGFSTVNPVIKVPVTTTNDVISGGIALIIPARSVKATVANLVAGNNALPTVIWKSTISFCKFLNT